MTELETFATVRGTVDKLANLAVVASADYHDDIYLKVQDDVVNVLMQTGGRQVSSYTTFSADYFAEIEGEAEAFVPVEKYLDYLGQAAADGTVEMTFEGTEGSGDHPRLADRWEASGAMNVRIRLPGSSDDLDTVPWGVPSRFNERNQFVSEQCYDDDGELLEEFEDPDDQKVPPTEIRLTAESALENIVSKADFVYDGDADYYPVVTEDESLTFDMGREDGDDAVWGTIEDAEVEGPDVNNVYKRGFDTLFGALEGEVTMSTAPTPEDTADAPLIVVQETDEYTTRHVLASFSRN